MAKKKEPDDEWIARIIKENQIYWEDKKGREPVDTFPLPKLNSQERKLATLADAVQGEWGRGALRVGRDRSRNAGRYYLIGSPGGGRRDWYAARATGPEAEALLKKILAAVRKKSKTKSRAR